MCRSKSRVGSVVRVLVAPKEKDGSIIWAATHYRAGILVSFKRGIHLLRVLAYCLPDGSGCQGWREVSGEEGRPATMRIDVWKLGSKVDYRGPGGIACPYLVWLHPSDVAEFMD